MLCSPPRLRVVPEPARGQPVVGVIVCYAGPVEAVRALRPLRELAHAGARYGRPQRRTWPYSSSSIPPDPAGTRTYWTGDFLTGLPDEAIEIMRRLLFIKALSPDPDPHASRWRQRARGCRTARWRSGSAKRRSTSTSRHPLARTLPRRPHPLDAQLSGATKPFTTGRVYVNFIGDEGEDRVVAAFGSKCYARLQALKDRYYLPWTTCSAE